MNFDLSKGTLANVLLIGAGSLIALLTLFYPAGHGIFSHFGGYFLGVVLGFSLIPLLRIRQSKAYLSESSDIIAIVGDLIGCPSLARPAYNLFLGDRIIERLHYLGQQVRFMYALRRLFQLFAGMVLLAGASKALLVHLEHPWAQLAISFLPPIVGYQLPFVDLCVTTGLILGHVTARRAELVLTRQRNLERISVLEHSYFFTNLRQRLSTNTDLTLQLFPNMRQAEPVPNIPEVP